MNPITVTPEFFCSQGPRQIKKFLLIFSTAFALVSFARGGSKEMAASLSPNWYADREWNVSLWGTYAYTNKGYPTLENYSISNYDTYLEADHGWGGGVDAKYFFWRYIGVGVQGYILDVRQSYPDVFADFFNIQPGGGNFAQTSHKSRAVGSVLGTLTLRYPIGRSRFAPYVFGGLGEIFGGGQTTIFVNPPDEVLTQRSGSSNELVGQFGGGLEVRITPHIGLINDFSWNVIPGGTNNDFGMVRTGINFAF